MRKVELKMNEQFKYEAIKELHDHGGNKNRVAIKLGITVRQVNRLLKVYKEKGKAGFVHGNRNRQPVNSLPQELIDTIVNLYRDKYQGWNFLHYTEFLNEKENFKVSYGSVYKVLSAAGINSPKIQRKTRKERAKAKLRKDNPKAKEEEIEEIVSYEIALEDSHPRQERAKYFGERVEMDASIHLWYGTNKSALHLAIDHSTGRILGGYFQKEETLKGYYCILKQILENYGIPYKFFTDNRTVFNYNRDNVKKEEKDVLTQFGYACKTLGISIETSSVSQAKGMIERANQTFQGRLVNELKLNGITEIDGANRYLTEVFIPDFNNRFATPYKKSDSVMSESPDAEKINLTLAVLSPRKFDNGNSIKYNNHYYMAYDKNMNLVCFMPHKECLVIQAFDGNLFISVEEKVYKLIELEKNAKESENFDIKVDEKIKKKTVYIPPMSHPWKRALFVTHQEQTHQFHQYGF